MKFKRIRLYPTLFNLEVWVGKNDTAALFSKYYGASVEYYEREMTSSNYVVVINSKRTKYKTIVMQLSSLNKSIIVHESYHVLKEVSNITGLEMDNQEWCAYFLEYLFDEIIKNNYTEVNVANIDEICDKNK